MSEAWNVSQLCWFWGFTFEMFMILTIWVPPVLYLVLWYPNSRFKYVNLVHFTCFDSQELRDDFGKYSFFCCCCNLRHWWASLSSTQSNTTKLDKIKETPTERRNPAACVVHHPVIRWRINITKPDSRYLFWGL